MRLKHRTLTLVVSLPWRRGKREEGSGHVFGSYLEQEREREKKREREVD